MHKQLTIIMLAFFISANAQDYIRTDFPLEISSGIQVADMIFSPGSEVILRAYFEIIPLSPLFVPSSDAIDLSPEYSGAYIQGSSYYAENELAVLWNHSRNMGGENFGYLIMQLFDTLGHSLAPEIIVDSSLNGYFTTLNISASPSDDNDIGIAWTNGDTLYSSYFNTISRTFSDKQKILTAIPSYDIRVADFLNNGSIRVLWQDADENIRHKRLSKTGTVVNDETVLYGGLNYWRFTKYASNANGDFLLADFHRPSQSVVDGIETRKFNSNGVAMGDPLWVCDSVPISLSHDFTRYVSISMQDDGKSVVVWSPYSYDLTYTRVVMQLKMQFLDENGNRIGETFQPVQLNTGSYINNYEVAEQYPVVKFQHDAVILLWNNYNEEYSTNGLGEMYMNIQRFTEPVVSGLSADIIPDLNHWIAWNHASDELMLMVETPAGCSATVEVIDMLGRPVRRDGGIPLQAGLNKVMLNRGVLQLPSQGVFLYRLNINGNLYQGKFLK